MGRITTELPGGGYATGSEAISALVQEADRRGTSYGKLMAGTTKKERMEIVSAYCWESWKKEKKRRKRRKGPSAPENQN